ncbi:MAG: hypothetical protein ACI4VQ_06010 [Clostridia bacterium]
MKLRDTLICGYYDDETGKDYIVEINTELLKQWLKQEELDLLDFETNIEKKIAIYNILEPELTKELDKYQNFTAKFI